MTPLQAERWRDFATRMARAGWEHMTPARRERLEAEVTDFLDVMAKDGDLPGIAGWDTGNDVYVCDAVAEFFRQHEHFHVTRKGREVECRNRFLDQIRCCLRAGLDVAATPSAGVLGFAVGDLRRMYDGQIPDWLAEQFTAPLALAADDAGVWL